MIHLNWHSPWEDTKSIKIKNRIINAFCSYTTAVLLAHKTVSYIKNLFHLITKLNKHLPSWKVNLNSSFDGGSWVWMETLRQLKPTWELLWDYFWASFFSELVIFMPQGGLLGTETQRLPSKEEFKWTFRLSKCFFNLVVLTFGSGSLVQMGF